MTYEIPGFSFTLPAGADLSSHLFKFVDVNSSGQAVLPAVGGRVIGALNNKPLSGEAATIVHSGIAMVVAGAAITQGVNVEADATGRATAWVTPGAAVGIALEAASAAGEIIPVLLSCNALAA